MKILITGSQGQLGYELTKQAKQNNFIVEAFSHAELDITDSCRFSAQVKQSNPDLIINTAAYTAVDQAEREQNLAFAINRDAAAMIAEVCAEHNIPLFHISTDYVFSGQTTKAYSENDKAEPINIYGASKLAGEVQVQQKWQKSLILRVSGVFGNHGNNFVKTMIKLFREREVLKVVDDQIICPTPAAAIADSLLLLAKKLATQKDNFSWGLYHYCSDPAVSWFEFSLNILEQVKRNGIKHNLQELIAIPSHEYKTLAKRPLYSALDCSKIKAVFNIEQPSWKNALTFLVPELICLWQPRNGCQPDTWM